MYLEKLWCCVGRGTRKINFGILERMTGLTLEMSALKLFTVANCHHQLS